MANFCGGIKLNPDTFEIREGVITLVDAHPDDPIEEVNTPCSQLYDSIIFEHVKHNGVWIMTSAGVDTDIPLANIITASCGANLTVVFSVRMKMTYSTLPSVIYLKCLLPLLMLIILSLLG